MSDLQSNDPRTELVRSNKVTAYWAGDGVAVGVFYRTHDKIATVESNSDEVVAAGFVMPEGTEEEPITAQKKLEIFKTFLMTNSSTFGIMYDPVDRRADEFKFPNKYDENNVLEYSKKMLEKALGVSLEKVQNNVIANMIKSGHVADGTQVQYGIGDGVVEITERYNSGSIKYATVKYPVVIAINDANYQTECVVSVVSGQLKKPRELSECAITMTGIKGVLIENGLLPKIEKSSKKESADEEVAVTEE